MPYKSNDDLPEGVRNALPAEAQNIWREVFNATIEKKPDDEDAARQAAWGAVKNAGFEKGENDKWVKKDHAETHEFELEVFSTGVHGGDPYTEDDLDDMVSNFAALKDVIKPPVKFGHRSKMHIVDGKPAAGWTTKLRRVGQKLIAKFSDVPDIVYRAIKRKLYRRASAEILWNFKHEGKTYRRVLYAVSLLGQDVPIVKDLADLQAFMSQSTDDESGSFDALKVCEFAYGEDGSITADNGGDDMPNKELEAKLEAERKTREKAEADAKKYADDLEAERKKNAEKAKKADADEIKTFCEQMVADGKMTPAGRDVITSGLDSGLHVYSEVAGWTISFETFKKYAETHGKVLPTGEVATDENDKDKDTKTYAGAGAELDAKAKKYSTEHKVDYGIAVEAILADDEDLAKRYLAESPKADEGGDD